MITQAQDGQKGSSALLDRCIVKHAHCDALLLEYSQCRGSECVSDPAALQCFASIMLVFLQF